jgi:dUTP pyrophosphatase
MTPQLGIMRLAHAQDLPLPAYETEGAAGLDLRAAITDNIILQPLMRVLVPTGLILEIPVGLEGQIRPRSGLAYKNGITLLNTPGTIDWDYRGEVKVLLINLSQEPFIIQRGLRIAQLIIAPLTRVTCVEISEINDTKRGMGGFGSTGLT